MGIDTDIFIGHSLSISQLLRLPHVLEAEYARPDSPLRALFGQVKPDEQFFAWPAYYFRDRRCWMVDPEAEIEETGSSTIELPSGLHVHVTRAFLDIGPGERWLRFLTIPQEQAKARAASRKIAELVGAHHVLYCADGMAHLWREGDASLRKPAGDLLYEGCNFDDVLAWTGARTFRSGLSSPRRIPSTRTLTKKSSGSSNHRDDRLTDVAAEWACVLRPEEPLSLTRA